MELSYYWKVVGSAYDTFSESEEARLKRDSNPLEFELTKHVIEKYIKEDYRVIDIGSGPGVYSLWLAHKGYSVRLVDVSERSLMLAQYRAKLQNVESLISTVVRDAAQLEGESDASYNLAIALGPIYHAPEATYVLKALDEIHRVLEPGGIVVLNILNPYVQLKNLIANESISVVKDLICSIQEIGFCHYKHEDDDISSWMCTASYMSDVMSSKGFEIVEVFGSKAIFEEASRPIIKRLKDEPEAARNMLLLTATIEEYIAHSEYILVVARKSIGVITN